MSTSAIVLIVIGVLAFLLISFVIKVYNELVKKRILPSKEPTVWAPVCSK